MRKQLCFVAIVAMMLQGGAALADPVEEISRLYADWRQAVESADIPGYTAVLDDDVRLLPPGAEAIEGAANYAQFLVPVFAAADYTIEVLEPPVVTMAGDFAVAEYRYVIHLSLKNPEDGVQQAGALTDPRTESRYIDVLRRDRHGKWKVWRHAWQTFD